jgi:5''-nucleotidase/2'',3''-cyclic phosphodiesterase and related esterases
MNSRTVVPLLIVIIAVLFVATAIIVPLISGPSRSERTLSFVIMTTSDLQSQVGPYKNESGVMVGGFSRISGAAKEIRATADGSLLISSGDDLTGTFYDTYSGIPEMQGMTLAGYNVVCPGNHEFDFGEEVYANATGAAGFPVVCANMQVQDPVLASRITPSAMLDVSGVKVGVFGLMTPDLARISSPAAGTTVDPDLGGVAGRMAGDLRAQGADLVIAVTHTGSEDDIALARAVSGIDLIVGGHDHIYLYEIVEGPGGWETVVVQDGMRGERLGILRFTWEGPAGTEGPLNSQGNGTGTVSAGTSGIRDPQWSYLYLDNSTPGDPAVDALFAPYIAEYGERLRATVGVSTVPIDTRKTTVRSGEAAAGDFIADAWRDWFGNAGIAIINGGGIRGDQVFPAGNITYYMLYQILPYRDEIVRVEMKGSDLREALEGSASSLDNANGPVDSGGFLQVSGIRFVIDTAGTPYNATYNGSTFIGVTEPGSRVKDVTVAGPDGKYQVLDDNQTYTVFVNNWLAGGGDGCQVFSAQQNKTGTTVYDIDPVAEYLRQNTPVTPVTDGRITIVNGTAGGGVPPFFSTFLKERPGGSSGSPAK